MASISFKYLEDKLILCYTPVIGLDDITKRLDTEDGVPIKHTFWVTKHLLCNDVEEDNDGEETLHFHIGTVGEVFVDELGERMRVEYLTNAFPKFLESHGLRRMRFHDLRHSCASLLLANGVPLKHIQEWLGHSDFTTTATPTWIISPRSPRHRRWRQGLLYRRAATSEVAGGRAKPKIRREKQKSALVTYS